MRTTRTLYPLNGQLRIAGETFLTHQVEVDPDAKMLVIDHPTLGRVEIRKADNITMEFLDLEVPTIIRAMQKNQGWEPATPKFFFENIIPTR